MSLDPGLRRTLRAGTDAGALAGIVSGSGPTCAFLCDSAAAALDVGTELAGAGVCRTVRVASGPVHGARVVPALEHPESLRSPLLPAGLIPETDRCDAALNCHENLAVT